MPGRINDPRDLETWMVKVDQRLRQLESRRLDAGDGTQVDHATKQVSARISEDPGNSASIGEDGGIKATDTVTTATDHTPLIVLLEMTASTNVANNTDTIVTWSSEAKNTGFTTTTTTVTIPEDGDYSIDFQWQWANSTAGQRVIGVLLNGTSVAANSILRQGLPSAYTSPALTAIEAAHSLHAVIDLLANDVLRFVVYQNSGGVLGGGGPYFGDVRGRAQVAKFHDSFPPALTQTTE